MIRRIVVNLPVYDISTMDDYNFFFFFVQMLQCVLQ
jgi:hypothetical protein